MAQSLSMSFSASIELTIIMEECMEDEKISRSELIKKAISFYVNSKKVDQDNIQVIQEIYKQVSEIKELLNKVRCQEM